MSEKTNKLMLKALKLLDPSDVDFHSGRYDSAKLYQELIRDAKNDKKIDFEWRISEIADACKEDGADWGNIPSLGGGPEATWQALLIAWGSGDTEGLEKVLHCSCKDCRSGCDDDCTNTQCLDG